MSSKANFSELEKCKENVRPNRSGRKITSVSQESSSRQQAFDDKRYELEGNLKIAKEPENLLESYVELIKFYEQYDLSKTLHLRDLLKQVIVDKNLEKSETVRNDQRYVQCFIRIMTDFCKFERTESLLKFMKSKKIGLKSVEYYLFGGKFYTETGNFKLAETYFNEGLYRQLPGNVRLLKAFERFEVMKKSGLKNGKFEENNYHYDEEVATKGFLAVKVGGGSQQQPRGLGVKKALGQIKKNDVYEDAEENLGGEGGKFPEWHGDVPLNNQENERNVEKWTESGLKKSQMTCRNAESEKFDVYEDTDGSDKSTKRKVNTKIEKILHSQKPKKEEKKDKTEPGITYAYPKTRCKTGTQIFQIEELRLINPHQRAKIAHHLYQKKLLDAEEETKNKLLLAEKNFVEKMDERRKNQESLLQARIDEQKLETEKMMHQMKVKMEEQLEQKMKSKVDDEAEKMAEMKKRMTEMEEQLEQKHLLEHVLEQKMKSKEDDEAEKMAEMKKRMIEMEKQLAKKNDVIEVLNVKLINLETQIDSEESPVVKQNLQREYDKTLHDITELDPNLECMIPLKKRMPRHSVVEAVSGFLDCSVETKICDGITQSQQANLVLSSGNSSQQSLLDEFDNAMGAAETPIARRNVNYDDDLKMDQNETENNKNDIVGRKLDIYCDDDDSENDVGHGISGGENGMSDFEPELEPPDQNPEAQSFAIFCDDEIENIDNNTAKNDKFSIFLDETEMMSQPQKPTQNNDNFSIFLDESTLPCKAPQEPEKRDSNEENKKPKKIRKNLFGEPKAEPKKPSKRKALGSVEVERVSNILEKTSLDDNPNITGIEPFSTPGHSYRGESTSFNYLTKSQKRMTLGITESPIQPQRKSNLFNQESNSEETRVLNQVESTPTVNSISKLTTKTTKTTNMINDPWCPAQISEWMTSLTKPIKTHPEFKSFKEPLQTTKFKKNCVVQLLGHNYKVINKHGEGNFARVYQLKNHVTNSLVAAKVQKSELSIWEFYMAKTALERIDAKHATTMVVSKCLVYEENSVLLSPFYSRGTLLDLANRLHDKVKGSLDTKQKLAVSVFYTYQITQIVRNLHQSKIIHADIKPDNFLINYGSNATYLPTKITEELPFAPIILTDFGRSIDCSLIKNPNAQFSKTNSTADFECTEMKRGMPWCYETDLYSLAGTIHVLLFNKYMKKTVLKNDNIMPSTDFPRYLAKEWSSIFLSLLNTTGSTVHEPNTQPLARTMRLLQSMKIAESVKFTDIL